MSMGRYLVHVDMYVASGQIALLQLMLPALFSI